MRDPHPQELVQLAMTGRSVSVERGQIIIFEQQEKMMTTVIDRPLVSVWGLFNVEPDVQLGLPFDEVSWPQRSMQG